MAFMAMVKWDEKVYVACVVIKHRTLFEEGKSFTYLTLLMLSFLQAHVTRKHSFADIN